jgi:hypothetical protein
VRIIKIWWLQASQPHIPLPTHMTCFAVRARPILHANAKQSLPHSRASGAPSHRRARRARANFRSLRSFAMPDVGTHTSTPHTPRHTHTTPAHQHTPQSTRRYRRTTHCNTWLVLRPRDQHTTAASTYPTRPVRVCEQVCLLASVGGLFFIFRILCRVTLCGKIRKLACY